MKMTNDFYEITPSLAIAYLGFPGDAYVETRLTADDTHYVKVVKANLIDLLKQFDPNAKVGYRRQEAGTGVIMYFKRLLRRYDRVPRITRC